MSDFKKGSPLQPTDNQLTRPADPLPPMTSLTASRDVELVRKAIIARYDFTPSWQYCRDLIDFVEACTDGQQRA